MRIQTRIHALHGECRSSQLQLSLLSYARSIGDLDFDYEIIAILRILRTRAYSIYSSVTKLVYKLLDESVIQNYFLSQ